MGNSNHTCPAAKNAADAVTVAVPITGSVTFQNLIMYICAGCVGVAGILCCFNIFMHLGHYSNPKQQRQIIRILFTPIVFALFSVFTQLNYDDAIYMAPIRDLYEEFAMAGIFLLFIDYVAPDPSTRASYFANLENRKARGGRFSKNKSYDVIPGGSLQWFKTRHMILFLSIVVVIIVTIAQEASQAAGTYCLTSMKPWFAHLWVLIFGHIATAVGIIAILRIYGRLKEVPEFRMHRPLLKLVSLKLIVGTNFLQTFIFSILQGQGVLTGNDKVTANDLQYGIPSLLVAVEQVIFAALMLYAYRAAEYKHEGKQMGFLAAAANALNPLDLIQSTVQAFMTLFGVAGSRASGSTTTYTTASANGNWRNASPATYSSGEETNVQPDEYGYNKEGQQQPQQPLPARHASPQGVMHNYGGQGDVYVSDARQGGGGRRGGRGGGRRPRGPISALIGAGVAAVQQHQDHREQRNERGGP